MNYSNAEKRYQNDPVFRQLVDVMVDGYQRLNFSPGELREAAVFSEIVHQRKFARPNFMIRDGEISPTTTEAKP